MDHSNDDAGVVSGEDLATPAVAVVDAAVEIADLALQHLLGNLGR